MVEDSCSKLNGIYTYIARTIIKMPVYGGSFSNQLMAFKTVWTSFHAFLAQLIELC